MALPSYKVKQHWHQRFHADASSLWLRRTMVTLFAGVGVPAPRPAPRR
jgi:hypothetical protein